MTTPKVRGELKWGILGSGLICSDFVQCLRTVQGANIVAVAARSIAAAQNFAKLNNIPKCYGSYDELADDDEIQVVYVGTIHPAHKEQVTMLLDAGKHVLCEKPMTLNYRDTKELIDLAQKKQLFLMEGMWTRFFPAIKYARQLINTGELGTVKKVIADFGFHFPIEERPDHRLVDISMGGGSLLDIGVYPIAVLPMVFGDREPHKITAVGHRCSSGADTSVGLCVQYGADDRGGQGEGAQGGGLGVLTFTIEARTPEHTIIVGTKGTIRIPTPAHCPEVIEVTRFAPGAREGVTEKLKFPIPLPPQPHQPFNFHNSHGFAYEAQAVHDAILAGKLQCEEYPLSHTLAVAAICDEARAQLGVVYPQDPPPRKGRLSFVWGAVSVVISVALGAKLRSR